MKKKALKIILVALLMNLAVSAQYVVNLNISYPAPTYLSDWSNVRAGMVNVVVNTDRPPTNLVKFKTQLQNSNGSVIAVSNIANSPVYTVKFGSNAFTLDKVMQPENMQFSDQAVIKSIRTSGRLPAGSYQLCISLLNAATGMELLKAPVCRPFVQVSYQLPYLLTPDDKTWLDANIAQTVITFRWSSIVPQPKEPVIYRLQVFEVKDGQKPMQAFRSNQPVLETEVRNTSQYFWRPQLSLKDSAGHVFIWTVQTLDSKGYPLPATDDNNLGRSEPRIFGVCDKIGQGADCSKNREF
jgi:hypothetical protein